MNRRITFRPEAVHDVETAVAWYSSGRPALALAFVGNLNQLLARIKAAPLQFPEVTADIRRALMARFTYGVFFRLIDDRVQVLGVLHLHRHPDTWRSRE